MMWIRHWACVGEIDTTIDALYGQLIGGYRKVSQLGQVEE